MAPTSCHWFIEGEQGHYNQILPLVTVATLTHISDKSYMGLQRSNRGTGLPEESSHVQQGSVHCLEHNFVLEDVSLHTFA